MMEMVGKATRSRYDELVTESLDMVEEHTRCQFSLGDAALELGPLLFVGVRHPRRTRPHWISRGSIRKR
jgi:hypothetical protein